MKRLKKALLIAARIILCLCLVQLGYAMHRTVQVTCESLDWWPFSNPDPRPEGISDVMMGLTMLVYQETPDRLQVLTPSSEGWQKRDADGDGLMARDEMLRMTSDRHADTDGDGLPDPVDTSPNGFASSYRERVESAVLSNYLQHPISASETAYCVVGLDSWLDVQDNDVLAVVISYQTLAYLRYFTDIFPRDSCRANGYVTTEPYLFIPGALYIYDLEYHFGGRCGGEKRMILIDLPFIGPVHVADKQLWMS
jgi:hypothetical protein